MLSKFLLWWQFQPRPLDCFSVGSLGHSIHSIPIQYYSWTNGYRNASGDEICGSKLISHSRDAQPTDRIWPLPNVLHPAEDFWMNLNFIELLTILQLITIWNSSEGKSIKPQAINRQLNLKKSAFYDQLSKVQLIILCSAHECTQNNRLQPFAPKRLCTSVIQKLL